MTAAVREPLAYEAPVEHGESPILIVDDHVPNLVALEAVLSSLGHPCRRATSGAEALRLLERIDFAVALLDVRMPGQSGLDVAARLRERSISTPIIFLTAAQEDSELRAHSYDRGAVDFIVKPFDAEMLRAKVRTFVELHAKRRELERLTRSHDAQRLVARQRVQALALVSERLSRWLSADEVAQIVITEAHDALQASASVAYLLAGEGAEGELALAAARGFEPAGLERLPLSAPYPLTASVRNRAPVWIESREALARGYPELQLLEHVQAVVALPLVSEQRCLGAVAFSYSKPKTWDAADREFLLTLSAQFLGALERSRLLALEREAHQKLARHHQAMRLMADVGTLLSSSLDYRAVLRRLTEMVVPVAADWCAVDVLDDSGSIVRLSAFHSEPAKIALALELERRYPMDPSSPRGVPNVLRTGKTEWMAEIPDSLLAAAARDEEHLGIIRRLGLASYVVVPLEARGRLLGALSLIYAESGRRYSAEDVRFVEELALRAAMSVDNALLFEQQVRARQQLERQTRQALLVGDVGAALTQSRDLSEALQRCTSAVVQHLKAAFARIWTLDPRRAVLELQASAGLYTHVDGAHARVPLGRFKIGRIAQEGVPHLTNDVQNDPWVSDQAWAQREGMLSFAGYPLIFEDQVIGVLAMFGREPLADDTLAALSSISNAVAVGIERARAERRAREERDTLEVLNEVGRALGAELDQEKLVQAITDYATRLAGAAFGAYFYNVVGAGGESYTLYAISGVPREAFARFPMPRNTKVFAPTFTGQGIVRVDDIRRDPRYGQMAPYHGMPEGHLPVASYMAVPVVSRSGSVIGGLFFGHPEPGVFTERSEMLVSGVAAQAAIAMDNARLFGEAQQLISQLDKKNKELDQFAYVASHDLKAPLRGIANLSQWLEEDLGDAITKDAKAQLDLLRNRVHRMEGLINGILDYSRAGRVRAKPERVLVAQLLADIIELLVAPPRSLIEVAPDMPELRTERVPLQQVFMNLIGNALKHSKRDDAHVRISAREQGGFFEFAISDNGPGIAPEYHERIWGIFQTLEPRDTVEGTGIGLSVVKKIVESKGGRAWVESGEDGGATFLFTWPRAERELVKSV